MKATVKTQITITANPTEVFKYLSDLRLHHFWNPQIHKFSRMGVLHKGAEYRTESLVLGVKIKSKNVITKFSVPGEIEITNNTGTVKYRANFKLHDKDGDTLVICATTVSSESRAFAFAKPIMQKLARRELQSDLQALKLSVENHLGEGI